MSSARTPQVVVHRDEALLAAAVAARLVTCLVDAQAARGTASVVLTGGGVGIASLASLAACPARDAIDWSRLDVWWGDERFLPGGHPDRNETQARAALLDAVDVDPARVHPMGATDSPDGPDPEGAASRYADELAAAAGSERGGTTGGEGSSAVPAFDVLLLGMGPEGHVASLFPESPALHDTRTVVAVHGNPKPPPTRLSLTLPAICSARQVWLIVSGDDKAHAVRLAMGEAGPLQVPAAGARGTVRTLALLDRAAASDLPPDLARIASP
ncbi:MAG: 6-phosphogluconolactonase [Actinomycetes bacterium]